MPRRIEDELKKVGANYIQAALRRGYAVHDGNLSTGQQNFSREGLGRVSYADPQKPPTEQDLLGELSDLTCSTPPGSAVSYSNLAVAFLGLVIAKRSGVRYRDFVSQRILQPLAMTDTVWDSADVPPERLAAGHDQLDDVVPAERTWKLGAMEAMGGLFSSARDMGRFLSFQIACSAGNSPVAGIRAESVRESHRPALEGPPVAEFGVNWIVTKGPKTGRVVTHTGSTNDYSTTLLIALDR